MFASKELERGRREYGARRKAELKMSAFGRGQWRWRLPARATVAVAAALGASLAWAEATPVAEPAPADRGGRVAILSPGAPPDFGDLDGASALPAVFNATRVAQDTALDLGFSAGPKFDPASAPPPPSPAEGPAAQDNPLTVYDPTAGPPLSPMQSALQAAMQRLVTRSDKHNPLGSGDWRAARAAIAAFYAARAYAPVWVGEDGLTEAGRAALKQLERAPDDGLDLRAFAIPGKLRPSLDPEALAEAETMIASAVVTYAEQATGSRVPPARVSPLIFETPSLADPGAALSEVATAADPAQRLADFNPRQEGYRELREALKRLNEARPDVDLDAGAAPRTKRPAARRIHTAFASASDAFAFGSLARQRAAIVANMEMWRWEPRDMGEQRIEVNVPDFSVAALKGDTVLLDARVIVGKPETPTPIFSSVMRYVIINPSWRVPDSIIKKEFMPKLRSLSRRGYEVKTVGGRLTVRQLPGDDNALGRIALMFPNDHAIYLHDTPARELFDEETRAFSHGCIRVEDPVSLAALVLGGETGGWTAERIEDAIGGKERTVFLPHPLPLHIEYFTEFADEFGDLRERPDVYGLTRRVEGMLARASQD
ncbi:MAG TPA: L,D-transpeptidase family protein [Roseiarcus sp.]|nr:L,D-transpeptidase family protein [Roseiarcus sp.]